MIHANQHRFFISYRLRDFPKNQGNFMDSFRIKPSFGHVLYLFFLNNISMNKKNISIKMVPSSGFKQYAPMLTFYNSLPGFAKKIPRFNSRRFLYIWKQKLMLQLYLMIVWTCVLILVIMNLIDNNT